MSLQAGVATLAVLECTGCGESFVACGADEGLLTGVSAEMYLQGTRHIECSIAKIALEWLFAAVPSHVHLPVAGQWECDIALSLYAPMQTIGRYSVWIRTYRLLS